MVESLGHLGQVLGRHARHGLVNVTQNSLFNRLVLDNLTQHTTVTTANHKHAPWVRVRVDREVCNHFLVCKLVALGALDCSVQDKHVAIRL